MRRIPLSILLIAVWGIGTQGFADSLDELLQRTGRSVELFWQQVPSFTCTESVTQEKINKRGKIEYKQESVFDYLALTKVKDEDLTVEEGRLLQKKPINKPNKPSLLNTNGFPTLLLIFHPLYQANYRFQLESANVEEGKWLRVRFEHIAGRRSTCALMLQERVYPLELQGTAWIDKETGAIQKVTAGLVAPMNEINIKAFNVEVTYTPQSFPSEPETRWLPSTAVIDIQTALQHWRNIHLFSQYKRFTVQSLDTISQ